MGKRNVKKTAVLLRKNDFQDAEDSAEILVKFIRILQGDCPLVPCRLFLNSDDSKSNYYIPRLKFQFVLIGIQFDLVECY